jgi:hypothetical protein
MFYVYTILYRIIWLFTILKLQGRTPRFLQDVVEPCLCGTCAPDDDGTCIDAGSSGGSSGNKPISLTLEWINTANPAPETIYFRFKNQDCFESATVFGSGNDTYFIENNNCAPSGNKPGPPFQIFPNLLISEVREKSAPLIGSLHTSCSDPLFVGLKFGPDCDGGGCNFEVIGGCIADPANATEPALCIGDQTGNSGEEGVAWDPTCVSFLTID